MKSERRHELEHNTLAAWLDRTILSAKPHVNTILGGALVIVLLLCAVMMLNKFSNKATADAWNVLYDLMMDADASQLPVKLGELAKENKSSEVGQIAAIQAADKYLDTGCSLLFSNKVQATEDINKAIENYRIVIENSNDSGLRQRAMYGLARAQEAGGDKEAITNYEKVAGKWPESPYAKLATDRVADLNSQATKQFYERFRQYQPKPPASAPGEKPAFDVNSLQMPQDDKTDGKNVIDLKSILSTPQEKQPKTEGDAEKKPDEAQPAVQPVEEKKPEEATAPAEQPAAPPATENK